MLSVITDFGCDRGCGYCIYDHIMPSRLPPPEDYYERLELAVRNIPGNVFSISGGGDPLHNFEIHTEFWSFVIQLCQKYNKRIDIHTAYPYRMIEVHQQLQHVLNKPVIHCFPSTWSEDKQHILALRTLEPTMRINFVIDHQLGTVATDVEEFCGLHKIPFSYRQLVGANLQPVDDDEFFTSVQSRSPLGRYIEQDDYNIYLSPQGELKLRYMEI